ncbi:MAG: dephospho-CoA kinase [Prevotella sp.]|nr:dephospho-CoA kinase [Prevotella sp.]
MITDVTRVAVTGGIGSGKSFVCQRLKERGIEVFNCDDVAKRLMRERRDLQRRLVRLVGKELYTDGQLNKAVMARFILASNDNARRVDAIVHPAVAEEFVRSTFQWMECAILFESGFDKLVDKIIYVDAPLETRIDRIMLRDNISREKALEWIHRQMDPEEARRRSHFIIINDGNTDIDRQLDELLGESSKNIQ